MTAYSRLPANENRADRIERTATIQRNDLFPNMPWQIRCYGQGLCIVAGGVPNRYRDRDRAARAAAIWIADGVLPADQPYEPPVKHPSDAVIDRAMGL